MRFTLASFNVHWGVRPDRRTPYPLLDTLRAFDADIMALQEVYRPDQSDGLFDALTREGYHHAWMPLARAEVAPKAKRKRMGGHGNWGVALFSRFPLQDPAGLGIGWTFFDAIGHRNALRATVDLGEIMLPVISVHTSSRVPWGPVMNLRTLRSQLPSLREPAIVAGDCNFWGPGVVSVLPGWRRSVRGRTWPAHRPHSQIDHILVSDPLRIISARVMPDAGSDHRPVRAILEVG